jgi:putative hemolysin
LRTNRRRRTDRDSDPERKRVFSRGPGLCRSHRKPKGKDGLENPRASNLSSRRRWVLLAAVVLAAVFLALQSTVLAQAGNSGKPAVAGSNLFRDSLIILFLLIVSLLFVMAETALLTVRRTRIEQLVEEGNRSAQHVAALLAEPTRMLATLQVGLTLVQLFSAGEATSRFAQPLKNFLVAKFPDTFIASNAATISMVTVILIVSLLTLVIGEITPKSLAIRHAERIALFAVWPIRWLQVILAPLVSLVTLLSGGIVRIFGGTLSFHASALSEEELKIMVEQSEEHGVIETEEKEMIHKVFEFGDTLARQVMTPRGDITAEEADASVDHLIRTVTESGHSRLPIYDDDLDNIVGIVHVKDVLRAITEDEPGVSIRSLLRPPYYIPENKRVDDLLTDFKRNKTQLAIVRDEYGTVVGLVTIEDLLEEIVGEIQDEYDAEEEPLIRNLDEHTSIVDGRMPIDDFNDRMGVELPTEESDTLGGFVFGLLGHQPGQGERAVWDGVEFQVEETDGRRIQKVRVIRTQTPEASGGDDQSSPSGNGYAAQPDTDIPIDRRVVNE